MSRGTFAMCGFVAGLLLAVWCELRLEDKQVAAGWFEHRGKIYVLTPARVEPAQ